MLLITWEWIKTGSIRKCVRFLTEIHIGSQGIAFDRLDLDAFADDYKNRNGRLGKKKGENGPWREEKHADSSGRAIRRHRARHH